MPKLKFPKLNPDKDKKPLSQSQKILRAIRQTNGATNWQLSKIALKYTSVISALRKQGYEILAVRQQRSDGKMGNTWRYYLKENTEKEKSYEQ